MNTCDDERHSWDFWGFPVSLKVNPMNNRTPRNEWLSFPLQLFVTRPYMRLNGSSHSVSITQTYNGMSFTLITTNVYIFYCENLLKCDHLVDVKGGYNGWGRQIRFKILSLYQRLKTWNFYCHGVTIRNPLPPFEEKESKVLCPSSHYCNCDVVLHRQAERINNFEIQWGEIMSKKVKGFLGIHKYCRHGERGTAISMSEVTKTASR
jgi:hypothetical protein